MRPGRRRATQLLAVLAALVLGGLVTEVVRAPASSPPADSEVALPRPNDLAAPQPRELRIPAASRPPACSDVSGEPCTEPLLDRGDITAAAAVPFGAIVLGADGVLERLHFTSGGAHARWRSELMDATGPDVSLRRVGTRVFVGTSERLHALRTTDGARLWSIVLEGAPGEPWRAWMAVDHVVATAGDEVVVVDSTTGTVVRREHHPHRAVLQLGSSVALLTADRVTALDPRRDEPRWSVPIASPTTLPPGHEQATFGPVVLTGSRTQVLGAADGRVLVDLGARATATRTSTGLVVALVWDGDDGTGTELLGLRSDGTVRWRTPGPEVACCSVQLRPGGDGQVVVAPAGGPGEVEDAAWLVHPATGRIVDRLVRPPRVGRFPVATGRDGVVWRDGDALVGVDEEGVPRWWAESGVTLVSESPLLLSTRDGLLRPRVGRASAAVAILPGSGSDPSRARHR